MGWFSSSLADICMLSYQWRNIMTIEQIDIDIGKAVRRWWWKDRTMQCSSNSAMPVGRSSSLKKNSAIEVGSLPS